LVVIVAALVSVRLRSFVSGAMNHETTVPAKRGCLYSGVAGFFIILIALDAIMP
jgi:hypothetical protein